MTVQLRTAPTADLTPAELAGLRALLDAAFDGDFTDADWSHTLGGVHVLATVAGELVGHGAVVLRQLVAGGRPLRTGYVEAVATAAPHRRRGVASALLTEVERVVVGGFELGALSAAEAAARLYAQRGWQPWTGPTAALTQDGVLATPDEGVFVLRTPATPELTGEELLACDWRLGDLW